jgi:hypothetical protein
MLNISYTFHLIRPFVRILHVTVILLQEWKPKEFPFI